MNLICLSDALRNKQLKNLPNKEVKIEEQEDM